MMSPHDRPPHDGTTANRRRLRPLGLALALTAALIALLWLAVGRTALAAPLAAPPEITGVTPGAAYNDRPTEITIAGVDFSAMPTVTLGTVLLEDVGFVDSETLTAVVPAGLPGGSYAVTVTNPDGESGSLPDAFTVLFAGDGSLGPWQPVESMQTPRVALSVVKADHFLYAVGGNNHGSLTSVERAEILPDGSLSPWQPVEAMTTARHSLATVYVRGHLYALGGYQYQGANLTLESVERAQVQPDGSLGPWELVAPMKKKRRDLAAVAAGEFVYAFGGGPFPQKSVERARINPDGSLGAWEIVSEMKRARTAPS
ncbi:MAG TPA: IPT/TIG domain-containing protein, partial [Ardenticatenaceae bacterium]|nr:IPT/TIG domain-containing protein [Ardenticatenaceae bacterium]